jgi:PEP-CTERM motif
MGKKGVWAKPALIAIGLALLTTSAKAAVFDFTITSSTGDATGEFTATGGPTNFNVTNVAGELNGTPFSSAVNTYGDADNILTPGGPFLADRAGIAFEAGGLDYNIFHNGTEGKIYSFCVSSVEPSCTGGEADDAPSATFTLGGVPEPAVWAMMLVGVGMIGFGLRLARRTDSMAQTVV